MYALDYLLLICSRSFVVFVSVVSLKIIVIKSTQYFLFSSWLLTKNFKFYDLVNKDVLLQYFVLASFVLQSFILVGQLATRYMKGHNLSLSVFFVGFFFLVGVISLRWVSQFLVYLL